MNLAQTSLTHLLDTGWIVRPFRGARAYDQTLVKIGVPQLAVSIISVAELYEGVCHASNRSAAEQSLLTFLSDKTILPITVDICRVFGEHRGYLRRGNRLIGDLIC